MKYLKQIRKIRLSAGVLAILGVVLWAGSAPGVSGAAMAAGPAVTLTSDQMAAIDQALQTALSNINPDLAGAARTNAVAQALGQVTASSIGTYGEDAVCGVTQAALHAGILAPQMVAAVLPAAVGAGISVETAVVKVQTCAVGAGASATIVAESIIATGALQQYAADTIGTGLGHAAAILSQTNTVAANQIGQVISNEGTRGMRVAYSDSVLSNGGSQQLADAGSQNPTATGAIGPGAPGAIGQPTTGALGTSFTTLPCASPSCT